MSSIIEYLLKVVELTIYLGSGIQLYVGRSTFHRWSVKRNGDQFTAFHDLAAFQNTSDVACEGNLVYEIRMTFL